MTTPAPTPAAADVAAAAERISGHVRRTPILRTEIDGRPLVLKLEQLQRTGSFKLRGATNKLLAGERPERVVTASGGNHGLAVATAASTLGVPVTVHAPSFVPELKTRRMVEAGARVVRHDDSGAAFTTAAQEGTEPGNLYLHPYDDPHVIAGQGTVTAEIIEDAPDVDSIVVAVGGGGLIAGAAVAAGGRAIIAVEPKGCPCLHDALEAGHPVESTVDSVAASGLGANRVGDLPLAILTATGVESILVADKEIVAARDRLWEELRLAVEPAAAVGFAAWLADRVPGELPALIICGANTEWLPS
ncbi:L-threonine ammonia-lyase [Herbihabitans rhizosphaerae]|uniref:L-threonine ammonia-lyase n=1 Tax=Herbihabitans rhizosphaerae TaxID=1872711 RepID=A0A4Q7KQE8_9PSEU|nr:serine/threonine dehydratase [Herbihabitans rhizosphaerae]RZS39058.1 L-threonine ammonia-lyase [Herbihabitans rhizosphaerae]